MTAQIHTIQNGAFRVTARKIEIGQHLVFEFRDREGNWRCALSNGTCVDDPSYIGDPAVEWREGARTSTQAGFYQQARVENNELVLTGHLAHTHHPDPAQVITNRIALTDSSIRVTVSDEITPTSTEIALGKLMTCLYFLPDGKGSPVSAYRRLPTAPPLDFAWIPALHWGHDDVVGDHVFRSPAAIVQLDGIYAALVPDLDLLAQARPVIRHALDLRAAGAYHPREDGSSICCTRLFYGFCTWRINYHTYYRHDPEDMQTLRPSTLSYGFDLFIGQADGPGEVTQRVDKYLWTRYGQAYFAQPQPQVLPFEEYGRKYAYVGELPETIRGVTIDGKRCAGIDNPDRRGANFHAWENDLVVAFGIRHYADKWSDPELRSIADGIRQLILSAPVKDGAFPCIYNFGEGRYEGSLYWTAAPADAFDGFDTAAMGVTARWMLYWHEHFGDKPELLARPAAYARFLAAQQLPSGAIPTYFYADLTPAKPLLESATTAISGAVLALVASIEGDEALRHAALAAGRFVDEQVLPNREFYDFETFYSCGIRPVGWVDPVSALAPQNSLCIQWTCDQMLALYELTGEAHWLERGEYALSILSLYQQVWSPPYYLGHLFGGFASQNTDGEWNDGRQARFVHTYADYYAATGNLEYLERAVAACRASFALMDIAENHANAINFTVKREPDGRRIGRAPENVFHAGPGDAIGGWSGFNWSAGGGLTASAYLERLFGSIWIDGRTRTATPIDGLKASVVAWEGSGISIEVASALSDLPSAYSGERVAVLRFGNLQDGPYSVTVNGEAPQDTVAERLRSGISIRVAG